MWQDQGNRSEEKMAKPTRKTSSKVLHTYIYAELTTALCTIIICLPVSQNLVAEPCEHSTQVGLVICRAITGWFGLEIAVDNQNCKSSNRRCQWVYNTGVFEL